jgi:hypothetical protein
MGKNDGEWVEKRVLFDWKECWNFISTCFGAFFVISWFSPDWHFRLNFGIFCFLASLFGGGTIGFFSEKKPKKWEWVRK